MKPIDRLREHYGELCHRVYTNIYPDKPNEFYCGGHPGLEATDEPCTKADFLTCLLNDYREPNEEARD